MRGTRRANLSLDGTSDVDRDKFTIYVMHGSSSCRQSLSSQVGMGSRSQDFDEQALIIFLTSSAVAGVNSFRMHSTLGENVSSDFTSFKSSRFWRMSTIFSEK